MSGCKEAQPINEAANRCRQETLRTDAGDAVANTAGDGGLLMQQKHAHWRRCECGERTIQKSCGKNGRSGLKKVRIPWSDAAKDVEEKVAESLGHNLD